MADEGAGELAARSNLTVSQLLIWTGQRLQPEQPLYNMVLAFRIEAALDPALFERAFDALVSRCDALRAIVEVVDGVPLLRFTERRCGAYRFVDLSGATQPEVALHEWLETRRTAPFELHRGLFDTALVKLADRAFVWYLNQHHIMTDAWSVAVLYAKLSELYGRAREGRLAAAAALPDFADYLAHERAQRDSKALLKAREYWRSRLQAPFAPSTFYRRTPALRGGRTRRLPCRLGAERSARLKALAATPALRAFTTELSLFQIFATLLFAYLHRIGGNRDLALGTPSHNRGSATLKETVGLFIEIFPLQVSLDEDETFASLYAKVSRSTHAMLLNVQPGASGFEHNRAYDVVLNFITAGFADFAGHPVRSQWLHADHGDRNHLLRLQVQDFDRDGEFGLYFDLNEDVFQGDEREAVVRHFLHLLDAFIDDTGQPLAGAALLDERESRHLVADLNQTAVERTPETVLELFARQVGATPASVALACDDERLSYRELDLASNRLANLLQARGLAAGQRAAIVMSRSIDAVVAILAVLKCGAAYVPVDPEHPPDRIAQLLADAAVSLVLCERCLADRCSGYRGASLCIDELREPIAEQAASAPALSVGPDAVAYVIYTSGSTGRPKGVVVRHASLSNYLLWARGYYLQGAPLSFAWFSSLAFDLTVTSTFLPLIAGGRLVIYRQREAGREIVIRRVIEDNAVDVIKLTPLHLSLLQTMDLGALRVRKFIVGGEDFKADLARSISRRCDRVEIYNEYGPTEATVACMVHRFDAERDLDTSVPIGRPIDNARIYLLDARLNPVPRGVAGEIFIGGAGVAAGYLNQPALSAERFLDDPFVPGARVYRSGDLARWNEDERLEYLGREDHQVKIRGVRIELAEIEAAIAALDGIGEAVVTALESHDTGDARAQFCARCGLSAHHPDADLDEDRVCAICRVYERERASAQSYFRDMDDLRAIARRARTGARGKQDSLMLLSGGKDSTYALCQAVEVGFTPLVFTLDNGYISEGAKANIRRVVDTLGLELVVGSTPAMDAIFVDSLKRHSNVCNGCFKTIYTLSMNLARERGIRHIITGLSRGQIFETRLADMFKQQVFDAARIDRTIIEARKAYHRMDDVVSRCLDVKLFGDDAVFEEIEFVDFYRYCDVTLGEMLRYLREIAPWIRPADTGRSTNCRINEAGIYVHKRERGFHNYALPYSWDVRLGHKERDAARAELDDQIDVDKVRGILDEIGYTPQDRSDSSPRDKRLVAYYVDAGGNDRSAELRRHLAGRLPAEYQPAQFVRLDALPLSPNHKVDRAALPLPQEQARPELAQSYSPPRNAAERALANVWAEILGLERVGVDDNFFDLGGDSILNIQIVARARQQGIALTPQQVFDHPTVTALAGVAGTVQTVAGEQGTVQGEVALTPIQRRFFEHELPAPQHYNQALLLEIDPAPQPRLLEQALTHLLQQHDALRSRFVLLDGHWQQTLCAPEELRPAVVCHDLSGLAAVQREARIARVAEQLHRNMDLAAPRLLGVANFDCGPDAPGLVMVAIHHLVVDAVSLWILLEDLAASYRSLACGVAVRLAPKTTSLRQWVTALEDWSRSPALLAQADYWVEMANARRAPLPSEGGGDNDRRSARTESVSLDAGQTARLLHEVPGAFQVQVPDVLLSALAKCIGQWSAGDSLCLDLESHGREELTPGLDLMRTVGWFTSVYPLRLLLPAATGPGELLLAVKEQLRAVPQRGIGYGVLRYLADRGVRQRLRAAPAPELLFNYFGQLDQALSGSAGMRLVRPIIGQFGERGPRQYLLEVNAAVFEGRLRVDWTYSANRHTAATVQRLAQAHLAQVRELIAFCLGTSGSGFSPSDFPQADLDQEQLDGLLEEFGDEA